MTPHLQRDSAIVVAFVYFQDGDKESEDKESEFEEGFWEARTHTYYTKHESVLMPFFFLFSTTQEFIYPT